MGEEEKVTETTTEEVKAEDVKTEEKKAKKEVKKPDVGAAISQAKTAVDSGKTFLTKFFGESKTRSKLVLTIMFAFQAALAFQSGLIFFLISALIALVGFVGLSAAIPADEEETEDKPEE